MVEGPIDSEGDYSSLAKRKLKYLLGFLASMDLDALNTDYSHTEEDHPEEVESSLFTTSFEPDDQIISDNKDDETLDFYNGAGNDVVEEEEVGDVDDEIAEKSQEEDEGEGLDTESIGDGNLTEDIIEAETKLSKYAQWKIDHEKVLAEKRLKAQEERYKRIEEMKGKLKTFLSDREEQISKTRRANEEAESLFIEERDSEIEGKEWERTFSMLGLGTADAARHGNKDVGRMKSVFFALKGDIASST